MRERADTLEREGAAGTIEAAIERWFTPEFRERNPDVVDARVRRAMGNDPKGYAAAYRVFATADMDEELAGIRAPTLVTTGEHDIGSTPRMARLIHERVATRVPPVPIGEPRRFDAQADRSRFRPDPIRGSGHCRAPGLTVASCLDG